MLTLLVIVGLSAGLFVGVRHWLYTRPIDWIPLTTKALDQEVGGSSPIVVFVGADWDVNSILVKEVTFQDSRLKQMFRRRAVIAFYGDWTSNASPEVLSLLNRVKRRSTPTVVVYPPDGLSPQVFDGLVSPEQVMRAIDPSLTFNEDQGR
ncbi:MAG: thioredoxin family protein [Planctomycetota bacterium]